MAKATPSDQKGQKNLKDNSLEELLLDHGRDKYKLVRSALRWAYEIKEKENLPDPLPTLIPRALRDLLTGAVDIKEVEKLPPIQRTSSGQTHPSFPKEEKTGRAA